MHARVLAAGGAVECLIVGASLTTRDFMAEQFLPGRSAREWGLAFLAVAVGLAVGVVVGNWRGCLLRWSLLAALGLHAGFAPVLLVYAVTEGASLVGTGLALFAAFVYAREVLRLAGLPW